MSTSYLAGIVDRLILHAVKRLHLPRQGSPGEVREPGPKGKVSKLGPRAGRYLADSFADGRRLVARRLRRWLRSG